MQWSRRVDDDVTPWVAGARTVLVEVARHYGVVIRESYLRDLVEGVIGESGMPSVFAILTAISDDCRRRGEPLLSALSVHPNGGVSGGYAKWIHVNLGIAYEDSNAHAARERLNCHRHFQAQDLPADGGSPITADQSFEIGLEMCRAARVGPGERRHQKALSERQRLLSRREARILSGRADVGAFVTVFFDGDESDVARVPLVALFDMHLHKDACSIERPLGRALLTAREGETRTYISSDGKSHTVTVVKIEIFRPGIGGDGDNE
jgi:Transcription elongation factor, GreA/GreB, C-term